MTKDFDFDNIEVTGKEFDHDFDFDKIFADGEMPVFDESLLDKPIGDYGADEPEDGSQGFGGVRQPKNDPPPKRDGGAKLRLPGKISVLELVGAS